MRTTRTPTAFGGDGKPCAKPSFAPEVLNRLDRVFVFRKLEGLDIARVTALEIEKMINNYGLEVDDQGIDPQIILSLLSRYAKMGRSSSSPRPRA